MSGLQDTILKKKKDLLYKTSAKWNETHADVVRETN